MNTSSPKSGHSVVVAGLKAEFPVEKVKQRPGGGGKQLDYIPIETALERLLEVAPQYNIIPVESRLTQVDRHWVAQYTIEMVIDGKTAVGTGAMVNPDPDMAVKSALSEAIKNAAKNGWGLALYLWDQEKLAEIAAERKSSPPASPTAISALRELVKDKARAAGWDGTGGVHGIAQALGCSVKDFGTEDGLKRILES